MEEEGQFKSVVIRQVNEKQVALCVPEQSTLRQVKEAVGRELNIPVCRQTFLGFDDDATVVRDGTELDLRVNLTGGCGGDSFPSFSFRQRASDAVLTVFATSGMLRLHMVRPVRQTRVWRLRVLLSVRDHVNGNA
jgi:hypothetical protein